MHDNTRSSGWSGDEPATWASDRAIQVALQSPVPAMIVLAQRATITLISYVANYVTTETLSALVRATAGVVDVTDTLVIGDGHLVLDWFALGWHPHQDLDDRDKARVVRMMAPPAMLRCAVTSANHRRSL